MKSSLTDRCSSRLRLAPVTMQRAEIVGVLRNHFGSILLTLFQSIHKVLRVTVRLSLRARADEVVK
jgi:hypothetical protein